MRRPSALPAGAASWAMRHRPARSAMSWCSAGASKTRASACRSPASSIWARTRSSTTSAAAPRHGKARGCASMSWHSPCAICTIPAARCCRAWTSGRWWSEVAPRPLPSHGSRSRSAPTTARSTARPGLPTVRGRRIFSRLARWCPSPRPARSRPSSARKTWWSGGFRSAGCARISTRTTPSVSICSRPRACPRSPSSARYA